MTTNRQPSAGVAYDVQLLFPALFLVGLGTVMVYSASSALALKQFGTDFYFLKKQAFFAFIGTIVLVVCCHIPYRWYRPLSYPLLGLAVVCLVAIHLTDFGVSAGGSSRWLRLGTVSFQPSELARMALVIYLAYSLSKKGEKIKAFTVGLVPHVLVLGVLVALVFIQPDFGSVVIFTALTGLMLFVGGVRLLHLATALIVFLPVAYYLLMNAEYRVKRMMSYLNPWQYSSDEGYQIIHSLLAFGTGGLWGTGIGKGYQKLFYLPEPHTDFIFSVIGEELGLIGVLVIIGLYAFILWRGISIARSAGDTFGSFLAIGLTSALGLQICINMGVVLGLLPTKGLTLPFLSYGGTSLLLNMASIGILMNISAVKNR
ncbi:MAG: putative lipid II flippase FtsW [Desulfobacterales bacterium]|nr:MAG: putative lipid II flippase FtsW [Desulfobacterales bacterium]